MPNDFMLVTGANGEIGHGLLASLCEEHAERIIALDLKPLDPSLKSMCHTFYQGDILDAALLKEIGGVQHRDHPPSGIHSIVPRRTPSRDCPPGERGRNSEPAAFRHRAG